MIESIGGTTAVVVFLALLFGYINGVLNSGSLVATAISSRSLRPRSALALASVAEFAGPFLFGTSVAATLGAGLLDPAVVSPVLIASALVGAITWNLAAVRLGWPTSSSHALVGGLVGAAFAAGGLEAIIPGGLSVVVAGLILGPLVGLAAGFLMLRLVLRGVRGAAPAINDVFKRLQAATVVMLALSHGTNDAQKTMAVIVLALFGGGVQASFAVPIWVVAASAGALALGVATGGSRIIRTLGGRLYRIRPVHGFSAQSSSAFVILLATFIGWPVSTAQVVGGSILGVGTAYRPSAVRWQVARGILLAWVVTMPVSAFAAAATYWLLSRV